MTFKPSCFVLIGLPCSGKTTYRKEHLRPASLISTDYYIEEYAIRNKITYKEAFEKHYKHAEKQIYLDITEIYIPQEVDCVWDQTNLSPAKRKKILNIFKNTHDVIAIVFPFVDFETFKKRNENRFNKISDDVFLKYMMPMFKEQDLTKEALFDAGFDEVRYVK
jgi:predicted kinase